MSDWLKPCNAKVQVLYSISTFLAQHHHVSNEAAGKWVQSKKQDIIIVCVCGKGDVYTVLVFFTECYDFLVVVDNVQSHALILFAQYWLSFLTE